MGKISGRIVVLILIMAIVLSGCGGTVGTETKNMNIITDNSTPEELYERALNTWLWRI